MFDYSPFSLKKTGSLFMISYALLAQPLQVLCKQDIF